MVGSDGVVLAVTWKLRRFGLVEIVRGCRSADPSEDRLAIVGRFVSDVADELCVDTVFVPLTARLGVVQVDATMFVELVEAEDRTFGVVEHDLLGFVLDTAHLCEHLGVHVLASREALHRELGEFGALLRGLIVSRHALDDPKVAAFRQRLRAIDFGRGFVEEGAEVGAFFCHGMCVLSVCVEVWVGVGVG